jgi:hypothetical protein
MSGSVRDERLRARDAARMRRLSAANRLARRLARMSLACIRSSASTLRDAAIEATSTEEPVRQADDKLRRCTGRTPRGRCVLPVKHLGPHLRLAERPNRGSFAKKREAA